MRLYAIGDLHGRLDLLDRLLARIRRELDEQPPSRVRLIFLGDFVDRGLDSRRVLDRVLALNDEFDDVVALMGNHEEVMLAFRDRPVENADWLQFGGLETLLSYGVQPAPGTQSRDTLETLAATLTERVPARHWHFLENLEAFHEAGDFFFTHAGVDPARPLAHQDPVRLRWMRQPFLTTDTLYGKVVVHGHTIVRDVDIRPNRVNLDTGAYHSGRLSALMIEGDRKRILQAKQGLGDG